MALRFWPKPAMKTGLSPKVGVMSASPKPTSRRPSGDSSGWREGKGFVEGEEDRHEIHAAKPRPALVRIVGVKMRRARSMTADQLGNRRFVAGHRLGIEMQDEIRMGNSIEEFNAFGAGDDKVRIRLGEGFEAELDVAIGDAGQCSAKSISGMIHRLGFTNAGWNP